MAIAIALIVLVIALAVTGKLSHGKSKKKKYIIWELTTMLAIAPLFSWVRSILYAIKEGEGFAGFALMMLMFQLLFLLGLVLLPVGIFKKGELNLFRQQRPLEKSKMNNRRHTNLLLSGSMPFKIP